MADPERVYIHELIQISGHSRGQYMHHMTANWVPVAIEERNQRCFGVWATIGSTGRWPETVNMWELAGWDGLARNFEVELAGGRDQDPSLAAWWAKAAELRRGGVDRIVTPASWCRGIDQLIADGVGGAVYAHELIGVRPGTVDDLLDAVADVAMPAHADLAGAEAVGAFRVEMVADDEAVVIWAYPSVPAWSALERAWRGDRLREWRQVLAGLDARWRRWLMVDAPLAPLRLRRQPDAGDRVPLAEV